MFEFFAALITYAVPVFVIFTMLNVGLTQKPSEILRHLRNYPFVVKMLVANFVVAPLFMYLLLSFSSSEPALKAGLLILSLCAGASLPKRRSTTSHSGRR